MLEITTTVFVVMVLCVLAHSVLSYVDVSFTDGRRYIRPFEQTVHGFMDVIPLVAVALLGAQYWPAIRAGESSAAFALQESPGLRHVLLLLSFAILAGVPVFEELLRTTRHRRRAEEMQRAQVGFATMR